VRWRPARYCCVDEPVGHERSQWATNCGSRRACGPTCLRTTQDSRGIAGARECYATNAVVSAILAARSECATASVRRSRGRTHGSRSTGHHIRGSATRARLPLRSERLLKQKPQAQSRLSDEGEASLRGSGGLLHHGGGGGWGACRLRRRRETRAVDQAVGEMG